MSISYYVPRLHRCLHIQQGGNNLLGNENDFNRKVYLQKVIKKRITFAYAKLLNFDVL